MGNNLISIRFLNNYYFITEFNNESNKIYKNENRTVKFSSRSRNPGVGSSSAINKIQKAPIPKFILRSRIINSKNICGITKVKKMHRSTKIRFKHACRIIAFAISWANSKYKGWKKEFLNFTSQ
jgi:hypothetical protein